jgi:hypothetical protein
MTTQTTTAGSAELLWPVTVEQSRKVVRAHVDHRCEFGKRKVLVEVLLDVLDHPPESAHGSVPTSPLIGTAHPELGASSAAPACRPTDS